ncbi:GNAT family N-acetyltransferase [Botryobacter ruber]|uniref:GNAT family N-acetyltransferase n=1 Tax=Botryobacter ruber TaxID=2171629 RepID=UPI000E0A5F3E|nr:GNAT family N-acetyltransferase [Botryobacter ruber]
MIELFRLEREQDLQAAYAIREQVFVVEQQVPREEEYDAFEETSVHYLATYENVPCGAACWRTTENGVKLERFAVLQEYRNRQVGGHILQAVLQDVQAAHPERSIYLHAQLPALNFYKRHGFEVVGELFSECDIDHYKMIYRG